MVGTIAPRLLRFARDDRLCGVDGFLTCGSATPLANRPETGVAGHEGLAAAIGRLAVSGNFADLYQIDPDLSSY